MEDVISMTTIEEAEGVFLYLESRIQKLRQVPLGPFPDPSSSSLLLHTQ